MDACTSTNRPIATLSLRKRLRTAFGAVCIIAAVASGAVAGKAAVMHLDKRAVHRVAHPTDQAGPRAASSDDDYVQLLASVGDRFAGPSGDY